jgi:hypothetical protein
VLVRQDLQGEVHSGSREDHSVRKRDSKQAIVGPRSKGLLSPPRQ